MITACFVVGLVIGWVIETDRQRRYARALFAHFQPRIVVTQAPMMAEINAGAELWEGDDQMASCQRCLDGDHGRCQDLLWDDRYGMHACGCTNEAHQEGG